MDIHLPSDRYPTGAARIDFFETLAQRAARRAGSFGDGGEPGHASVNRRTSFGKPEIEGTGHPTRKCL